MENEDKLTAEGYRKQLETNYSLKLPADQVTPFIRRALQHKAVRNIRAGCAPLSVQRR